MNMRSPPRRRWHRPLRNDRHEAVIFSHGSTAGLQRSPREQYDAPPPAVIRYFVSRGYTLVAPLRRGRNESSGTYVEECSVYLKQCTAAEQTAQAETQLQSALADTNAVIDQLILGKLVPKESKLIAAGISRGGFLSLMLAGERPTQVKGVVNFVGGWRGVTERLSPDDLKQRMAFHASKLAAAAQKCKGASAWFYASGDPFYTDNAPREWFQAWQAAGGRGEFVYITDHNLPTGHAVAPNLALWQRQVDAMLTPLEQELHR